MRAAWNSLNIEDYIGKRYGRLVVLSEGPIIESKSGKKRSSLNCICDCGKEATVSTKRLKDGTTSSCGCYHKDRQIELKKTHGRSHTSEYNIWCSMKQRCTDPKLKAFPHYGGRGIKVCSRWLESFENFYEDMGERPKGKSLDRLDNEGNYEKDNCAWRSRIEQANNKRSNVYYLYQGESKTMPEWARKFGISIGALATRLGRLGMTIEQALNHVKNSKSKKSIDFGQTKLKAFEIEGIFKMVDSYKNIADKYNCSTGTVMVIKNRTRHQQVTEGLGEPGRKISKFNPQKQIMK